jgi:RNA polymerase sigma factor (sigma-70 family)
LSNITKVFLDFRSQLERYVRRFVGVQHVEDIVQETFVKSLEAELSSDIKYARTYLLKTAKHLALNHLDKWDNKYAVPLEDLLASSVDYPTAVSPEHYAQSNERFMSFCQAADQLEGNVRKAFILKKVYGQSQKEIAHHLGLSESTIEKHVAKGLRHCADYLLLLDAEATPGAKPVFHSAIAEQQHGKK